MIRFQTGRKSIGNEANAQMLDERFVEVRYEIQKKRGRNRRAAGC